MRAPWLLHVECLCDEADFFSYIHWSGLNMEREFKILPFVFWLFIPVPFFHTRQFFWYGTHWMILCLVGWVTTEHLEKTSKFLFTWPTVTLITSKALWGTYLCCKCCKLLTTVLRNSQVMWTLISYCDDCLMPILLLAVSHVSTIIKIPGVLKKSFCLSFFQLI